MPDLFTAKESNIILQDYQRLNYESELENNFPMETDEMLTEHPLDTVHNEDLPPEQRNMQEKSIVLAPYNSIIKLDDTFDESDDVKFEPKAIKFGKLVRDINRQYEQNNNADLDNGVINEAV